MIIGLTGGIGAGKSTVLELFEQLGVPTIKFDDVVHEIYNDPEVIAMIHLKFGDIVYSNGEINRKELSKIAFKDKSVLEYLQKEIGSKAINKILKFTKAQIEKPYVMLECAKILDTELALLCNLTVLVTADESIRIERTMKRDNLSEADVRARINNQMSQDEMSKLCEIIIENNGSESLLAQVYNTNLYILDTIKDLESPLFSIRHK